MYKSFAVLAVVMVGTLSSPARAVPIVVPQDIMFVADDSGSISPADWVLARNFMSDLNSNMPQRNLSRVGVVTFSTNAILRSGLNIGGSTSTVSNVIDNLIQSGGNTSTRDGVSAAITEFQANSAPLNPKLLLLITDGNPNPASTQHPCTLVPALAATGITTVVVGVGSAFNPTSIDCLLTNSSTQLFHLAAYSNIDGLLTDEIFLANFGLGYVYDDEVVPTPAAMALLALGLIGLGITRRAANSAKVYQSALRFT